MTKKSNKINKTDLFNSIQDRIDEILKGNELNASKIKGQLSAVANDLIIYRVIDGKSNNIFDGISGTVEKFAVAKAKAEARAFIKIGSFVSFLIAAVYYFK